MHESLDWKGIAGIGAVRSTVNEKGQSRVETRYFITSTTDADRFSRAIRSHWSIENGLHWHLDTTFDEDKSRFAREIPPGFGTFCAKLPSNASSESARARMSASRRAAASPAGITIIANGFWRLF